MEPNRFCYESEAPVPAAFLEQWHHRPGALRRLLPPDDSTRVTLAPENIENGSRATLRVRLAPGLWVNWEAEHTEVEPGIGFTDVQLEGPFRLWYHRHEFLPHPDDPNRSLLRDSVSCEPFGGTVGKFCGSPIIKGKLERLFAWRHRRTIQDVTRLHALNPPPLHILVSGATGLIGRSLLPYLIQAGHRVTTLSRTPAGPDTLEWQPEAGPPDLSALDPIHAVIHLAGENVASGRWTAARRKRILESRVLGTRHLAQTIAALESPPAAFVCASGISIYPADGRPHDETSPTDPTTFLGSVVRDWEAAAAPARDAGIRTVHLRTGVVLSQEGGALGKLLPLFRACLGGPIGLGRAWMSWISLDDHIDILHRACVDTALEGIINATAPEPVTNAQFTSALAKALHRPSLLPVPPAALRLLFGQMADETILASHRILPARLTALAHPFRHPTLPEALRDALTLA